MSGNTENDRIDNVAAGDLITIEHDGTGARQYKVVHKTTNKTDTGIVFTITLATDDGDTFDIDMPAGSPVIRSLEAKWESPQSPTPHSAE
jgi:hypothetical protein